MRKDNLDEEKIIRALLERTKEDPIFGKNAARRKESWVKFVRNIKDNPHAFLVGCLMNGRRPYEVAMEIPHRIRGLIEVAEFKNLSDREIRVEDISNEITPNAEEKRKPRQIVAALERVARFYDGNTANIWRNRKSPVEIIQAFFEFDGIGIKNATLATRILICEMNIKPATGEWDKSLLDISPDTHIKRVFVRTGLSESEDNQTIIDKARLLHRGYREVLKFPGALDSPVWHFGREICKSGKPVCKNPTPEYKKCPLDKFCPKIGVKKSGVN